MRIANCRPCKANKNFSKFEVIILFLLHIIFELEKRHALVLQHNVSQLLCCRNISVPRQIIPCAVKKVRKDMTLQEQEEIKKLRPNGVPELGCAD